MSDERDRTQADETGTHARPAADPGIDPADLNQDTGAEADSEEPDPELTDDQRPRGFVIGGQPGVGVVGSPANDQGV